MGQVFAAINAPAESWLLQGTETARVLMLATATPLTYNVGSPDTLPALTPTSAFDTTTANWIAYTVQGSNTLSIIQESAVSGLSGTFALLARVVNNRVDLLQQAGGGGGVSSFSYVTKTADYTIDPVADAGKGFRVDASGGNVTITLPDATGATQIWSIKRVDTVKANTVAIATTSGQTIDGAAAATLVTNGIQTGHGLDFAPDDTSNWSIKAAYYPSPLTTLGDLMVADADALPERLPVGTDTDRVTANSAAANGLGVDYEP